MYILFQHPVQPTQHLSQGAVAIGQDQRRHQAGFGGHPDIVAYQQPSRMGSVQRGVVGLALARGAIGIDHRKGSYFAAQVGMGRIHTGIQVTNANPLAAYSAGP